MKKLILKNVSVICVMIFFSVTVTAKEKNAATFLDKGFNAKHHGLGLSGTGYDLGNASLYVNSSFLTETDKTDVTLTSYTSFETQFTGVESRFRVLGLAIGLGYYSAMVDDIQESKLVNGRSFDTGRELSYEGQGLLLGSSVEVFPKLNVGITGKYIREKAATYNAQGVGVDIGINYQGFDHVVLGLQVQNAISPELEWNTPSKSVDVLGQVLTVGASVSVLEKRLRLLSDIRVRENRKATMHYGVEYELHPLLQLRAGVDDRTITLGTSITIKPMSIDFSYREGAISGQAGMYRLSVGMELSDLKTKSHKKRRDVL